MIGTTKYVSPEVMKAGAVEGKATLYDGMKADVWACGVILFLMLECRYPFDVGDHMGIGGAGVVRSERSMEMRKALLCSQHSFKTSVGPQLEDLMARLFDKEPSRRPTAADTLLHPWMLSTEMLANDGQGPVRLV